MNSSGGRWLGIVGVLGLSSLLTLKLAQYDNAITVHNTLDLPRVPNSVLLPTLFDWLNFTESMDPNSGRGTKRLSIGQLPWLLQSFALGSA